MLYTDSTSNAALPQPLVADRRVRYRRSRRQPAQPTKQQPSVHAAPRMSSAHAEARVRSLDQGVRWRRIMALSSELSDRLPDAARGTWLALEEALHGYWLDVAVEHYNQGFDAGATHGWLETELSPRGDPRRRLRAIAAALTQLIEELEGPNSPKA